MIRNQGKVILAGAGPGDPELITVKALRYLREADVVISDRLVAEELLSKNVKAGAQVIHVGKQGGSDSSFSQETINELLVKHAIESKLVLRLKGGDVSFFSNVLDELKTLVSHNIQFEIVPGVTAASGAAAYAGVPLTARGYATSVRFISYNPATTWDPSYWRELAETNDTLVFYMSSSSLDQIVRNLESFYITEEKYVAVIEQATTPYQKVHFFNLANHELHDLEIPLVSPTLIIIGRVVQLYKEFQWIDNMNSQQSYFRNAGATPESKHALSC